MNRVVRRRLSALPHKLVFEVRLGGPDILPLVIKEWAGLELAYATLILKVDHGFVT